MKLPLPKSGAWERAALWETGVCAFAKFSDLQNIDVWQKSALLGITKKYKVGTKEGDMQQLYDFGGY